MQSSSTLQVLCTHQCYIPSAFGHNAVMYGHLAFPRPMGLSIPSKGLDLAISKRKQASRFRTSNVGGCNCRAQLSKLAPAAAAVYGTLLLGGGLFAYTRSKSKGSLFGGITGGILLGTVYFLLQAPETKGLADALGFGTAFLFAAVFGIRLASTRKLVPSGLLLGLSVGVLVVFATAYFQDRM